MAELTLTVQASAANGVALSFQAMDHAANTYKFPNHRGMVRAIFRGYASATGSMIIAAQVPCNQGSEHDLTSAANALDAASKEVKMGPFDPNHFEDADGFVFIEKSGTTTGTTVALVKG